MSLLSTFKADLKAIEKDLDNPTLTWNGESYICIPSSTSKGLSDVEMGGFNVEDEQAFTIRKELFTDGLYPQSQQHFVYKGNRFRILAVKHNVNDALVRITCKSID